MPLKDELPKCAWLVSKMGRLTVGVQYEPQNGGKEDMKYKNLMNWSCAIGYGVGSGSPLSPSFNFGLELAKRSQVVFLLVYVISRFASPQIDLKEVINMLSCDKMDILHCCFLKVFVKNLSCTRVSSYTNFLLQFIASFYQHVVVQRRFNRTMLYRVDDARTSNNTPESSFQVAASWQANKNFLLKGKLGPLSSTLTLAFKSWWKPSFTFNISATRDRTIGKTQYGFGLRVENLREASYQRADPNFVMLTPSKEHLAEGNVWKIGERPMLQSDVNAGNFEELPRELRPLKKIL
ncbi:hypothetical protein Pint_02714 [Pistacia integerrima]|uniref:Uncharacterized protein n=1 Tax=Pistacia integerrima TaxID=434235 RepID=A0ACC0ZJ02_9ROSI|nr:hypothetical protein Pint_02714 [Pistacia integerrima]